jgi:long-subunit fatty acid transport protein
MGTACNYNSDRAAEGIRIRGSGNGFAFALGALLLLNEGKIIIGASYASRVVALSISGDAWVTRSQAAQDNAAQDGRIDPDASRQLTGRGAVHYALPDTINAGVTWKLHRALWLIGQLQWMTYGVHDKLVITLTGSSFREAPQVPARITHYRGFQDTLSGQLGVRWRVHENVFIEGGAMIESSAVPRTAVTAAAIDNIKFEGLVAMRWQIDARFSLGLGYVVTIMPPLHVGPNETEFAPSLLVNCADSHFDVNNDNCRRASDGRGLASAAGTYTLFTHRWGLSLSAGF